MWIGLAVVLLFLTLILTAYNINCFALPPLTKEAFVSWAGGAEVKLPLTRMGPPPRGLLEGEEKEQGREYKTVADLPKAPNGYLAGDAPVQSADPVNKKASTPMIYALLNDMKAFQGFELPYLAERGDPNIQTSISTFRGQYQSVLEEAQLLNQNPGIQSTLTLKEYEMIYSNLRYLQKQYRNLENVGLVPDGDDRAEKKEGFTGAGTTSSASGERATLDDLLELKDRLDAEIRRLSSSGTDDPVLRARVDLFTTLRNRIEGIINDVSSGVLSALDIPIMKSDVDAFLPALSGSTSADSGRVAGGESLARAIRRWFMSGSVSNGSGNLVDLVGRANAENMAEKILKGMSLDVRFRYIGDNEVSKAWATATEAVAVAGASVSTMDITGVDQSLDGFVQSVGSEGGAAGGTVGTGRGERARGEFDSRIRELDMNFLGGRPSYKKKEPAKLDWRERAKGICENIRKAGLDPSDYGCMVGSTQQVGPNFSWRGHAKMVCTRLETNAVAGTAVSMGCPPVEWKGWRS